ncbi:MAG: nitroreductase family protein [Burkholderiaceae bacterium]|nr:nitroreductase family protein [Burkholderiaceae bacterium]
MTTSTDVTTPDWQGLVQAATLAPSSHNTQPWLFRIGGSTIELLADRTRALPVNDPEDRELSISCGCALLNLRIAAAAAGLRAEVLMLPDGSMGDLLARIRVAPIAAPSLDAELQGAMAERRTYRERFDSTPVDPDVLRSLAEAAASEGATLTVLETPEQRLHAAALVAEGDSVQWANPSWRRELAAWMHPRRRGDGLTLPALAVPVAQMVVRTFDMGNGVAAKDRQLADESPVLAVLATAGDTPHDWLAAGQALQRLLLLAVSRGLQASYLNQPVQIASLRPKLQQLTRRPGHAQLLLRLGAPLRALPATPRRPLPDIQLAA